MTRFLLPMLVVLVMSQGVPAGAVEEPGSNQCHISQVNCQEPPQSRGDQELGAVVTEGVQFPGVSADSELGRAQAENADCENCEWTITPACVANGPESDALCADAATSCAEPGDVRYRVYLRRPPGPWQLVDTVCLGPGERPTSVEDIGELVRERVVNYLPDSDPSFQPAAGGVVNIPTLFAANEPRRIETESFDVLGFEVVVTATARWEWTFDEGVTTAFDEPGGRYPDDSVSHTYRDTGARAVSVTTYWRASFTVDGDGPFAVPGPELSKTAGPLTVPVRQARSVLVGG
jgi:hypothetical protein